MEVTSINCTNRVPPNVLICLRGFLGKQQDWFWLLQEGSN